MNEATYPCPTCGKKVPLWPFVYGDFCPHCRGGISIRDEFEKKTLALPCKNCGAEIQHWITAVSRKCHKCNQDHGILDKVYQAKEITSGLREYVIYLVRCVHCGKEVQVRELIWNGWQNLFPSAGHCGRCKSIVCWSCARLEDVPLEHINELRRMNIGSSAIVQTDKGLAYPHCPKCDKWLDSIFMQARPLPDEPCLEVEKRNVIPPIPEELKQLFPKDNC